MSRFWKSPKLWLCLGLFFVIGLPLGLVIANHAMNSWVESGGLENMLDRQTSKGLKLEGHYQDLTRSGWLGLKGEGFDGIKGAKTIVSLQAQEISGTFNPLGVFLKRWEVDDIHLKLGTVMLQKTEGSPVKPPGKPWYLFLWPDRVYLQDVKVDEANILWHLNDKESGIYKTFLEITPNGRDFEYDALGGDFKTPITPRLMVRHAHMLIRKPRLWCNEFILGDDDAHPEQQIKMVGDAGLQEDRSIHIKLDVMSIDVAPWLPAKMRTHIRGNASGHFEYDGQSSGLETGKGQGQMSMVNGLLRNLPAIQQYIKLTGSPDPGDVTLKACQADLHWDHGALTAENIQVEGEGVFRIEGSISLSKDKAVSGNIELGLTNPYLKWLPTAKQAIFTRQEGIYHFATVHLSGTLKKPEQDLTQRVTRELEKSPFTALKLFFNQAGDWFDIE